MIEIHTIAYTLRHEISHYLDYRSSVQAIMINKRYPFFMLLPFRSHAIRYFLEPTLASGEFHDYDTILFLFGNVTIE